MLQLFQPNIVIASVGRNNISQIDPIFDIDEKHKIYAKERNANGELSKTRQIVVGREIPYVSQKFYFANGSASTTPFGRFTNEQKMLAGKRILCEHQKITGTTK